jgi:hypothetical protein
MMCLRAYGIECDEEEVAKVMGVKPMQGATWEDCVAAAQHYGMRCVWVCPCSVEELKGYVDRGVPAIIGWNPEGRDWSHASVVYDVTDGTNTVIVADPNIPDPTQTTRTVPKADFYRAWAEKWPRYLVRRPAIFIEPEIDRSGRAILASERKTMGQLQVNEVEEKLRGARVKLGMEDEGHEGRFKECPGEEPCMTVEEVAKVVGPEFSEQNKKQPKFKSKKKGLSADSLEARLAGARQSMEDEDEGHEGRFKECPGEEPCMTVEEVAKVVGPEFSEQNKKQPKFKSKKKGARGTTVHIDPVGNKEVVIRGVRGETDPKNSRQALMFLDGLMQMDQNLTVIGPRFSLGPYQTATGDQFWTILDKRGDIVAEGQDPKKLLWGNYLKLFRN